MKLSSLSKFQKAQLEDLYHINDQWLKEPKFRMGKNSKVNPSHVTQALCKSVPKASKDENQIELRGDKSLTGLKNLGATCYMNALMQVLYSIRAFRQGVYEWDGSKTEEPICYQMQLLFTALQKTNRLFYDPKAFVEAMNMNAGVQQDAQEFYKFLIGYIERVFGASTNPIVKHLVKNQFEGQSMYTTICTNCKSSSRTKGSFHELDLTIEGCNTLEDCITEWLGVEHMHGDNQYKCGKCGSLQNAQRSISIVSLPEVLNIQLLRFVYNIKVGHRVKVKHPIYFPTTINMKKFLAPFHKPLLKRKGVGASHENIDIIIGSEDDPDAMDAEDDDFQYDLTAYLIHKGASSIGGHYVANILDEDQKKFFEFDDEDAHEFEWKKGMYVLDPKKDLEEDKDIKKNAKLPVQFSLNRGFVKSSDCYFLTYSKRTGRNSRASIKPTPPAYITKAVEADNVAYKAEVVERETTHKEQTTAVKQHKADVEEITKTWMVELPGIAQPCNWISLKWLTSWIKGEFEGKPEEKIGITTDDLLCEHDKLDFTKMEQMKRITPEAWDRLVKKYKLSPTSSVLDQTSYCWDCVQNDEKAKTSGQEKQNTIQGLVQVITEEFQTQNKNKKPKKKKKEERRRRI